jgi:hypothetical protein
MKGLPSRLCSKSEWFCKTAKKRPATNQWRHQRQLVDLWTQVCALSIARSVGIVVPDVYLMLSPYWAHARQGDGSHKSIRAMLWSKKVDHFTELSFFYKNLSVFMSPAELYEHPDRLLGQFSEAQKVALGQLIATAFWLDHWDLLNNIDCANAGFKMGEDGHVEPVLIDGGNALDEGFNGQTKLETASLFSTQSQHSPRSFEERRIGYQYTHQFSETIYPFMPRVIMDQKKLFWQDPGVIKGFMLQAEKIRQLSYQDLEKVIQGSWQRVIDDDGFHDPYACATIRFALRETKSRWLPQGGQCQMLEILHKRAQRLERVMAYHHTLDKENMHHLSEKKRI